MYTTLNQHYQSIYGCKVYKLSIDAGFSCPNRDGTLGNKGCIFCSGRGSGDFAECGGSVTEQLQKAKAIAKEFGVKESGGSDFHGDRRKGTYIGSGEGNLRVPMEFAENLRGSL